MKRNSYPLQWPEGRTQTAPKQRVTSSFGTPRQGGAKGLSPYEEAKLVLREIKKLGGSHVVITSMLPTRHDGLPYSDGKAGDSGIAVWFVKDGRERVFACDAWKTPAENLHSIALSVAALRGLERWRMADVLGLAMAGFAALPAGGAPPPSHADAPAAPESWRAVLDLQDCPGSAADLLDVAKARHRRLMTKAHPDAGGSHEEAVRLNEALRAAIEELGQRL